MEQGKPVRIPAGDVTLFGDLGAPRDARGIVLFAHGSGSSRLSPRNAFVARTLNESRLATLLFDHHDANPAATEVLTLALGALTDLAEKSERLSVVELPPGGNLYEAVARALGEIGRAFNAARAIVEIRAGRQRNGDPSVGPLVFARWTKTERRLAPPLIVEVQGGDLRPAALVAVFRSDSAPGAPAGDCRCWPDNEAGSMVIQRAME